VNGQHVADEAVLSPTVRSLKPKPHKEVTDLNIKLIC